MYWMEQNEYVVGQTCDLLKIIFQEEKSEAYLRLCSLVQVNPLFFDSTLKVPLEVRIERVCKEAEVDE